MAASDAQVFLKMEDLHSSPSASAESPSFDDTASCQNFSIPPPVIVHSKPAKKRKSWGQELPEPKTALPPRKRAKTDDEKEQRRIERIKRNRAAAHNSRERKRQETETLAVALARANAELEAYRQLHGPLPASVILPEVTLSIDSDDMPVPALSSSRSSRSSIDATSPPSPSDHLFDSEVTIKQETTDSAFPPAIFEHLHPKPASLKPLDPTQHSAEMLCDLQCRSSKGNGHPTWASAALPASFWATLFLRLTALQLRTTYHLLLLAMWSHSPSRMARMIPASTPR